MALYCEKSGMLTTVQDFGRTGYRHLGINVSGAMDEQAVRLLNVLLGNDENAAVLEMHFPAGVFMFEDPTVFAVGGADFRAQVDTVRVETWQPTIASKGACLTFARKINGNRCYLAVAGGVQVEPWLCSRSTNLAARVGGFYGRPVSKGDRIRCETKPETNKVSFPRISRSLIPAYSKSPTLRIIAGAEYPLLPDAAKRLLTEQSFVLSRNSNRMGFRLEGEPVVSGGLEEMISAAVSFGTIQLLPDGNLIILMADHQTSGGYPRVAHVISKDLPLAAQLGPGDKLAFELVSLEQSENAMLDFERELDWLRVGIRLMNSW